MGSTRKRTRSESVTDELRALLVQGKFEPEQRLQENIAADLLGVSRTPIRAALNTLAAEGLLTYRPNRGYVVRSFDLEQIEQTWHVRAWLEGLGALFAAQHGLSEEDEATLARSIERGARIFKASNLSEGVEYYREANIDFHRTIIKASRNLILSETVAKLNLIPMSSDQVIVWDDFTMMERAFEDHKRLFDAITARQGWRAEALMREHIFHGSIAVKKFITRRNNGGRSLAAE